MLRIIHSQGMWRKDKISIAWSRQGKLIDGHMTHRRFVTGQNLDTTTILSFTI